MLLSTSSRDLVRSRASVCVLFALLGATMGSWASRIPDVRDRVVLDDAHWGLANVGSTLGSLVSLLLVTALVGRVGPRRLSRFAAPLLLLNAPLLASATHPLALVAGLVVQGFAANMLATPSNAQAVQVERATGRRIMSSFHACFSLGQLTGGGLGILAAAAGVAPAAQLGATSAVLAVLLAATARWQPSEAQAPATAAERRRPRLTAQLGLLAGIALLSGLVEGTTIQWSALYTADALGAGAAAGAATVTCFSLAMTVGRLCGDRVVDRLGRARAIRACALLVAVGGTTALVVGTPLAALAGFALVGLGAACIVPTVYGLAGNQPGVPSAQGVAVVAWGMWPAFLVGPPLVGGLAGAWGLRTAMWLLPAAALTVVVLAGRVQAAGSAQPVEVTEPAAVAGPVAVAGPAVVAEPGAPVSGASRA